MTARGVARLLLLAGAVWCAGCAPLPPPGSAPVPPTARDTSTTRPRGRPATRPGTVAMADSAPSAAALRVLASIPEPLGAIERVPPPAFVPVPAPDSAGAPEPGADAPTPGAGSDVPVPAPTPVLGERPPGTAPLGGTPRDSGAARADTPSAGAAPATPPPLPSIPSTPPAAQPPPRESAPSGACWRVQILAPKTSAEAAKKRSAAESLLLVPMVIEREKGLFKIRTRECFTRATADVVRGRAVASGFSGAFPFEAARR